MLKSWSFMNVVTMGGGSNEGGMDLFLFGSNAKRGKRN
jgi:hypothetical protein